MDDELRKAVRDVLDIWDARLQVGMWAVTEEMEDLRAALAKNAGALVRNAALEDAKRAVVGIANADAGNPYKQALRIGAEAIDALKEQSNG